MKYILLILSGALLIAVLLSVAVSALFGSDVGYFFARFIAGPVGLIVSFFCSWCMTRSGRKRMNDESA